MAGQAQLTDILDWLLEQAVLALDDPERDLGDDVPGETAPERQFVEHGSVTVEPSDECAELLSVMWRRFVPKAATQNPRGAACTIITTVDLGIELRRCNPQIVNGVVPSAEQETAANMAMASDTQAIWKWITRRIVTGELPEGTSCDHWRMLNAEPVPPAGGVIGSRVTLNLTL